MQKELIILDEDKAWAKARIAELEKAIRDLGPEFYDVFNQSSETWHDRWWLKMRREIENCISSLVIGRR